MDEAGDIFAQIDRLEHGSYTLNDKGSSARRTFGINEEYDPTQLSVSQWSQQGGRSSEPMHHDPFGGS